MAGDDNSRSRRLLLIPVLLTVFIFAFAIASDAIEFDGGKYAIVIHEPKDTDGLGLYRIGMPLDADINLTFNYSIPLGDEEANLTAIVHKDKPIGICLPRAEMLQGHLCIDNNLYLGKISTINLGEIIRKGDIHGNQIVSGSDPKYDFREIFFDFEVNISYVNVTSSGLEFNYKYQRDKIGVGMSNVNDLKRSVPIGDNKYLRFHEGKEEIVGIIDTSSYVVSLDADSGKKNDEATGTVYVHSKEDKGVTFYVTCSSSNQGPDDYGILNIYSDSGILLKSSGDYSSSVFDLSYSFKKDRIYKIEAKGKNKDADDPENIHVYVRTRDEKPREIFDVINSRLFGLVLDKEYWKVTKRENVIDNDQYERLTNYCSNPADFEIIGEGVKESEKCNGESVEVVSESDVKSLDFMFGSYIIPYKLPHTSNGGILFNPAGDSDDTSYHLETFVKTGEDLTLTFTILVNYGVSIYVDDEEEPQIRVGCAKDEDCEDKNHYAGKNTLNIKTGYHKIDIYLFCKDHKKCFLEMKALEKNGGSPELYFEENFEEIGRPADPTSNSVPEDVSSSSAQIISVNDGLKDIERGEVPFFETGIYRDLKPVATSNNPNANDNIQLSMRLSCGNQEYGPCKEYGKWTRCATDVNGWITDRILSLNDVKYAGFYLKDSGEAIFTLEPFDHHSLDGDRNNHGTSDINYQHARNAYSGDEYIGGVYKCSTIWTHEPGIYSTACPEENDRYDSNGLKCCYLHHPENVSWNGIMRKDESWVGEITIKDYEESKNVMYIVNYLPYAGYGSDLTKDMDFSMFDEKPRLCAYTEGEAADKEWIIIQFNNTGTCDKENVDGDCCYCDVNSGCTLNCKNEFMEKDTFNGKITVDEDEFKASKVTLPFPSLSADYKIEDIEVKVEPTGDNSEHINLELTETSPTSWRTNAELDPQAPLMLREDNFTISVNLYDDFGFTVPDKHGLYYVNFSMEFIENVTRKYSDGHEVTSKYLNNYDRDDYSGDYASFAPWKPSYIVPDKISFAGSDLLDADLISFAATLTMDVNDNTVTFECSNDVTMIDSGYYTSGESISNCLQNPIEYIDGEFDCGESKDFEGPLWICAFLEDLDEGNIYAGPVKIESTDTEKPSITIKQPSNGDNVVAGDITVSGSASDNVGINKVEVAVGSGDFEEVSGKESWSVTVNINPGSNTITAKAHDTSGNYKTDTIDIDVIDSSSCDDDRISCTDVSEDDCSNEKCLCEDGTDYYPVWDGTNCNCEPNAAPPDQYFYCDDITDQGKCDSVGCYCPGSCEIMPYNGKCYCDFDQDKNGIPDIKVDPGSLPPVITASEPSGTVTTSTVTLSVTTNEDATCNYDTIDNNYELMGNTMSDAQRTHTAELTGLSNGEKIYYIRCKDLIGNVMTTSKEVTFIVNINKKCTDNNDCADGYKCVKGDCVDESEPPSPSTSCSDMKTEDECTNENCDCGDGNGSPFWSDRSADGKSGSCLCTKDDDVCRSDNECDGERNGEGNYPFCDEEYNMCYKNEYTIRKIKYSFDDPSDGGNNNKNDYRTDASGNGNYKPVPSLLYFAGIIKNTITIEEEININFTAAECTGIGSEERYYYDTTIKTQEGKDTYVDYGECEIDAGAMTCPNGGTCAFTSKGYWRCIEPRGVCRLGLQTCGPDSDFIFLDSDNEAYPSSENPLQEEVCNGLDDDCNGYIDDTVPKEEREKISREFAKLGIRWTGTQITQCGCFPAGSVSAKEEVCDNIDNDCDGKVDNDEKTILVNNCTDAVKKIIDVGWSPDGTTLYEYAFVEYLEDGCDIEEMTIDKTQNLTINNCTRKVFDCYNGTKYHTIVKYDSENDEYYFTEYNYDDLPHDYAIRNNYTYCAEKYYDPNECAPLENRTINIPGEACVCSDDYEGHLLTPAGELKPGYRSRVRNIIADTEAECNAIDENCDSTLDNTEYPELCGCFGLTNETLIDERKDATSNGRNPYKDYNCTGKDEDCDGVINEMAEDCACTQRWGPEDKYAGNSVLDTETVSVAGGGDDVLFPSMEKIKELMVSYEMCNGIDDNCNNEIDEDFPDFNTSCGYPEYSACYGGIYICNITGENLVCNTTTEQRSRNIFDTTWTSADLREPYETCDGIDSDCNGTVDDGLYPLSCGCYNYDDVFVINGIKESGDETCNGIDDNCNEKIDDETVNCACRDKSVPEIEKIKTVEEMCDGVDNNCNEYIDEDFTDVGKPCGFGACANGARVCDVYGLATICNTTVGANDTFGGDAFNYIGNEVCNLTGDEDCDGSIDEGCPCTPDGISKICGYNAEFYYSDRAHIDNICDGIRSQLKDMVTKSSSPADMKYKRIITVTNNNDYEVRDYPVSISIAGIDPAHIRNDSGDIRILDEKGNELIWKAEDNILTFRSGIIYPSSDTEFYLYYGSPARTYSQADDSEIYGLERYQETFLKCDFDETIDSSSKICSINEDEDNGGDGSCTYACGKRNGEACLLDPDITDDPVDAVCASSKNAISSGLGTGSVNYTITRAEVGDNYCSVSKGYDSGRCYCLTCAEEFVEDNGKCVSVSTQSMSGTDNSYNIYEEKKISFAAVDEDCMDNVDNDGDGFVDCDDVDCFNKVCSTKGTDVACEKGNMVPGSNSDITAADIGKYMGGINLDANGHFLSYPTSENINPNRGTVEMWIYLTSEGTLFSMPASSGELKMYVQEENLHFSRNPQRISGGSISTGNWYHVACSWDNLIGTKLYVDGTEVSSDSNTWTPADAGTDLFIGSDGENDHITGKIDELRISKIMLPAGEIKADARKLSSSLSINIGSEEDLGSVGSSTEDITDSELYYMCQERLEAPVSAEENTDFEDSILSLCDSLLTCNNDFNIDSRSICKLGRQTCSSGGWEDCSGNVVPGTESCNGIDEDCNGVIDDFQYSEERCACYDDAHVPGELAEDCNGVDDDCDGQIDEGLGWRCACADGAKRPGGNEPQICNGIDDDCNGIIDDGIEDCACADTTLFNVEENVTDEKCNYIDDNCNGEIDEDFPMLGDECGGGNRSVCEGGTYVCMADGFAATCDTMTDADDSFNNDTTDLRREETCNGLDDDCDGEIDEGLSRCACTGGVKNAGGYEPQICNGIDDNCNGRIDEGVLGCPCANTTAETIHANITEDVCDGIDNNCNGEIDEDFIMLDEECGGNINSACYGGTYVCSSDKFSAVCSTMTPTEYSLNLDTADLRTDESCNGIDDDCNGVIDDFAGSLSDEYCSCYEGRHDAGELQETCNGIDDDCNGIIDNGLSRCACSELSMNGADLDDLWLILEDIKRTPEICNNIDDDCNGRIDDGLDDSCFCANGYNGSATGRPEFCNGVDDDCNGIIDDVPRPYTCACYKGQSLPGIISETCNGIDDDCNGIIDDKWPEKGAGCGVGVCSGGMYRCGDGNISTICTGNENRIDINLEGPNYCEELDNNCNIAIDEGCKIDVKEIFGDAPAPPVINRTCGSDIGECTYGLQIAVGGKWGPCLPMGKYTFVQPEIEECNGLDDDCDGIIDNIGGRENEEETRCGCFDGRDPSSETCNGIDDDCDGIVDNVGGGSSVESTKCGCYDNKYAFGAGLERCNGIDDDCNGIIDDIKGENSVDSTKCGCFDGRSPKDELCNDVDDDCDMEIDEDFSEIGNDCGTGYCSGLYRCSDDKTSLICDGNTPTTEVCDSVDNDCDGEVDEGCYGNDMSSCENGIKDGSEEGIDCGGNCPNQCAGTITPEEDISTKKEILKSTWFTVFVIMVLLIIGIGIVLQFGLKTK